MGLQQNIRNYLNQLPAPAQVWLGRGFCLALMVLVWWLYAYGCESWRVEEDLLARGKTTVAERRKGDYVSRPDTVIVPTPRRVFVIQNWSYTYVAEGREYETYAEGKVDPVGQAVTYLPEDPTVHRLGVIQPQSPAWKLAGAALMFVFLAIPTLGFVMFCVVSPSKLEPTRQGGWVILGLSAAQIALALTVIFLVRQPVLVILALYVPSFVGGIIAAILCVRFFAWRWNIKLSRNSAEAIQPERKRLRRGGRIIGCP
jgi:hypothetical protein